MKDTYTKALQDFVWERCGNAELDMQNNPQNGKHGEYSLRCTEESAAYDKLKELVGGEQWKVLDAFDSAKNAAACVMKDAAYVQGFKDAFALMKIIGWEANL